MKFKTLDDLLNSKFPFVIRWGILLYCCITLIVIYLVMSFELSGQSNYDNSRIVQADQNTVVIDLDKNELPQIPDLQKINISLQTTKGNIDLGSDAIELNPQADSSIQYTVHGNFADLQPEQLGDIQLHYRFSLLNLLLGN